jgi:homoaconitase/3-isopropylmalate dehydratase large subunit
VAGLCRTVVVTVAIVAVGSVASGIAFSNVLVVLLLPRVWIQPSKTVKTSIAIGGRDDELESAPSR